MMFGIDEARGMMGCIGRVRPLVERILNAADNSCEAGPLMLVLEDLDWYNILVEDSGALIDWQCVTTALVWRARCYP